MTVHAAEDVSKPRRAYHLQKMNQFDALQDGTKGGVADDLGAPADSSA
jgi:hypothetical protein